MDEQVQEEATRATGIEEPGRARRPLQLHRHPDVNKDRFADFAGANPAALEKLILSTGFYRQKARWIRQACKIIDEKYGGGNINILQDLALTFDSSAFEPIVFEVFNELLLDFCRRLVDYDVDIVLLAGHAFK